MKKLDLVLAWALVVLGVILCGSSLGILHASGIEFSWSFSGGTAVVATGFLNVIRNGGGRGIARTAAVICSILLLLALGSLATNLLRFGTVGHSLPVLIALAVVLAETLFSIFQ